MKLTLPKPPSVNALYRFHCRRGYPQAYIDAKGKAWFEECAWLVKAAQKRRKTITSECEVAIDFYTHRAADLDNICKASLDLLEKTGVIENDNLVTSLVLNKYKASKKDERIELTIL